MPAFGELSDEDRAIVQACQGYNQFMHNYGSGKHSELLMNPRVILALEGRAKTRAMIILIYRLDVIKREVQLHLDLRPYKDLEE